MLKDRHLKREKKGMEKFGLSLKAKRCEYWDDKGTYRGKE